MPAIILFASAILAILISHSPWSGMYQALWDMPLTLGIGHWHLSKPLLLWVNEGLMSIFFFHVGLEIKREIVEGELHGLNKIALPGIAALGGMIVPALIYVALNWHSPIALRGWAIPSATDIAFSLGILGLLKTRVPPAMKIFLAAVAIFDDIGAIAIIAIFYTVDIAYFMLLLACFFIALLIILNRCRITRLAPYLLIGLALWLCVLKSGVHATFAGVILALAIPTTAIHNIEQRLAPWVAFLILPIFAFANSGISFLGLPENILFSTVTIGIAAGLLLGKSLGIGLTTWCCVKLGLARLPQGATGLGMCGIALVAGIGFTMSLFIGSLAFPDITQAYPSAVRLGVIMGSLLSGMFGYWILCRAYPKI